MQIKLASVVVAVLH